MKVLVVEDNEDSRKLLMKQLRGYGHEVIAVINGAEALEQALAQPPDIIVSDIMMPKMDGFQLCHECKQNEDLKNIPFVFYTATYLSAEDEKFALKLGVDAFIRKPTDPDTLAQTLSTVFEKAKSHPLSAAKVPPLEISLYLTEYSKRIVAKLEQKMAELETEITEHARAEYDLEERVKELHCLYGIATVAGTPDLTLNEMFEQAVNLLPAGWQYPKIACARIAIDDKVFETADYQDTEWKQSSNINVHGAKVGRVEVCYLEQRPQLAEGPFLKEERPLIDAIAKRLGEFVEHRQAEKERRRATEKLLAAMKETIHAIAVTVETRDPYTAGHQRRVTDLASAIGKELGLSEGQTEGIRMAGIIHDIGKIYVPAEILSKPGSLAEVEFSMIKMHAQAGFDILKTIEFPWPIAQIVLQHHERVNGSGYPLGLSGEDILLEARILAVGDVVEAMASHRPYRPALGLDKALEEIAQNKGKLYDSEVANACIRLFTEGRFKFEN